MNQENIHFIGIGGAGNLIVNVLKEEFGNKFEYSVVRKQDYGTIFPEIENYTPKSKRLNYYDKNSLPESFLEDYENPNRKYILVTGSGGVFSSYFIQKMNESFKSKELDFSNLIIEPLKLEGTAINRSLEVKSSVKKVADTYCVNLEEIKSKFSGKITLDELFDIAKNDVVKLISKTFMS